MNLEQAREVLIDACVNDWADGVWGDRHFRNEVARDGFIGFAKMPNVDLCSCVTDAGLQEENDEVNEAWETLDEHLRQQEATVWIGLPECC